MWGFAGMRQLRRSDLFTGFGQKMEDQVEHISQVLAHLGERKSGWKKPDLRGLATTWGQKAQNCRIWK
jgi:hypothetical protein